MRKNILRIALPCLLLFLCACQKDNLKNESDEREILLAQGRYLAAENPGDFALIEDKDESKWFTKGTPFRLVAYARPYRKDGGANPQDGEAKFRFNKVAWDGETEDGLKYINIDSEPDKWFGFSRIGDEVGGQDNLVSLDFYGFTYGKPVAENERPGYIVLDQDKVSAKISVETPLDELTVTETVGSDRHSELKDLLHGQLLNQNIESAGKSASTDAQSIIPFTHCFSFLHFFVVQQGVADGTSEGFFPGISITDVKVTGTYGSGSVHLKDGRVELNGDPIARTLNLTQLQTSGTASETVEVNEVAVTTKQAKIGEMLVFPSHGNDIIADANKADGYNTGLEITFKCPTAEIKDKFVGNLTSTGQIKEVTQTEGGSWQITVRKDKMLIANSATEALRFRQNTEYFLVISFQNDAVRVITVVPTVEEWLPGEGNAEDPWQEQAIGQPQMFDNVIWSDRNLGADHFDPIANNGENFEDVVGYFYQSGRNIPYYPYDYTTGRTPDYDMMHDQGFADKSMKWHNTDYRFYPVMNSSILNMAKTDNWIMTSDTGKPQMMVSETKQLDSCCNFMNNGLSKEYNMHWEQSRYCQPTSGGWVIPTSDDFMKIFPTTPLSGNITLRNGSSTGQIMNWGSGSDEHVMFSDSEKKTLRVTVPFYKYGSDEPSRNTPEYVEAWNILKNHEYQNEGTTHLDKYINGGPDMYYNLIFEPDNGDPRDGAASVYVISGEPQDTTMLADRFIQSDHLMIKSWGTIYGIKRVYTPQAYRMRWRALIAKQGTVNPCIYIEICRYRAEADDHLNEDNYMDYDWDHPVATLYFPVCGLGDHSGEFINFGTECQYATSDPISDDGTTSAVQIKITGDNATNAYIAIIENAINRNFGKQIRPVGWGGYE